MKYHNITKDDMLNGDGLRVVLWVSGCEHHCPECQNPITWDPAIGAEFDKSAKDELFCELAKDYVSGITFSGGDPLHHQNRQTITELAKEIKQNFPTKTIWLYSGYTYDAVADLEIMDYIDVMVDGRFVIALKDNQLLWKGSSNQNVIDVKATKKTGTIVLHSKNYDTKNI